MANKIERITTEYIRTEDRIRLCGQIDNDTATLWLTQRLANGLAVHMCQWLENSLPDKVAQAPSEDKARVQAFAQQSANAVTQARAKDEPPVVAKTDNQEWLIHSIQVQANDKLIRLLFQGAEQQEVYLEMGSASLRQWLNILCKNYKAAQWPDQHWPEWMKDDAPVIKTQARQIH